jgi:hypothetical protein
MKSVSLALAAALLAAALAAAGPAAASRFFSYDPADDATRRVAGDLTFEFKQKFVWVQVLSVHSTEGEATAQLRPADEHVLGSGGLSGVIGSAAHERDLYEVQAGDQGAEMIHAFCPGSTRAWMAFGHVAEGAPLRVQVIGDAPGGGRARLCETLVFNYHGEWALPSGNHPTERELLVPRFPY